MTFINGVREYLQEDNGISDDEALDDGHLNTPSPTLLLGLNKAVSKEDLLVDIPPRPVTDRLVAQFINSKEPVLSTIHFPTFQKEAVSLSWLAFLYAILTLSVTIQQRLGEPLPVYLEDSGYIISTFRKRAAQCLVQSNYTQPGKYKVEALFYYTLGEFYRSNDAQVSVSFLLGITIRLAMRTGYHRDPRHFPSISAYEGEMRRRVWATMRQLDTLISFQVGLPRTIQDWQDDVELPRNICDEDFGEGTTHLPPSRPESELTTASYIRAKSRIMAAFGKISDLAYSRKSVTYDEILEIDRRLEEVYGLVPFNFRIRPVDQSFADPSDLILRRYTLELLYQKARCVLHRRYLGEVHSNLRYAYSRWVCMSASKEILRHQADLHHETQPGGILYRDRQFPNSLQNADYLLAAMIICLELSHDPPADPIMNSDVTVVIKGREDLLTSLETSHQIFEQSRRRSTDAQKAYAALTIMLRRVKKGVLSTTQPIKRPAAGNPDDRPVDMHTASLLSNNGNGNNNNNGRTLTATRALPYAPESLYKVIASVESYSQFLPFLTASTVTHRDPETGYPTRAFLTVGYGPLSETFTSRVDCDRSRWIVEARSGAKFGINSKDGQAGGNFPGANEGIFEYLSTKWELVPLESEKPMTKVDLEIQFEFRNQLHAAMMSAVEGQMAGVMIEAFEKRIRDVEGRR
ncbi:hypothetical protein APSETT445_007753 [Aspergillus pseudonomiae]